jgi:hypothetical protein
MITTGAHLNNRKWKECADSFYSSPPYLQEIYRKDEEKGLRRAKEKFNSEYKRVCGTMGWRDYNRGNLSAMETADLGPIEVKMRQIIEEQDAAKMDKDEEKSRQLRLANLESCVISGSATASLKPIKKSKVITNSGKEKQVVVSSDEVRCGIILNKLIILTVYIFNRRIVLSCSTKSRNLPCRNGKKISLTDISKKQKNRKQLQLKRT